MVVETILMGALANLLFHRKPAVGKLDGSRIKKSEAKKAAFSGDSGIINDEMYYDKGAVYFTAYSKDLSREEGVDFSDKKMYFKEDKEDVKNLLNAIYERDGKILLKKKYTSNIVDYYEYFGFNQETPLDEEQAVYFTLNAIANGQKFIWSGEGRKKGLQQELFGKNSPQEKRHYRQIISSYGDTPAHFAEKLDRENNYLGSVIEAILMANSPTAARNILQDIYDTYLYDHAFFYMSDSDRYIEDQTQLNFLF